MTKLTNPMRDKIVAEAVKDTFKEQEEAWEKRRTALADQIFYLEHGEWQAQAQAFPRGVFRKGRELDVSIQGFGQLPWRLRRAWALSKDACMPASGRTIEINPQHKLYKSAAELMHAALALEQGKSDLTANLYSVLRSCSTVKQLQNAWPLGEKYFPTAEKLSLPLVLVGVVPKINKIMGLPPKVAAKSYERPY